MKSIALCISSGVTNRLLSQTDVSIVALDPTARYRIKINARGFRRGHSVKSVCSVSLERKLGAQLNCTRITHSIYEPKSTRGDCNLTGAGEVPEIRVIENIEGLAAKLQRNPLAEVEILEQREVEPLRGWAKNNSTAAIANHICYGSSRR